MCSPVLVPGGKFLSNKRNLEEDGPSAPSSGTETKSRRSSGDTKRSGSLFLSVNVPRTSCPGPTHPTPTMMTSAPSLLLVLLLASPAHLTPSGLQVRSQRTPRDLKQDPIKVSGHNGGDSRRPHLWGVPE